ncbi:MAG: hypothetical protein AAF909_02455 [Pseudomonadota bacterium]
MLAQIVGLTLAMTAAAYTGGRLAAIWPTPRLTPLKGALLGPLAAGPTTVLLHALGGGGLGFTEFGFIDWPPVFTTLGVGAACGVIIVGAIGLVRLGSRRPFG